MKIFFLLLLALSSYALDVNFKNFKADFTQKVVDENSKELLYEGKLLAKYPNQSLWKYVTPVEKEIYLNDRVVTMVEPDLEQVIIQKMQNEINLLKLLKDVKKISKERYETEFGGVKYTIIVANNTPSKILYRDKFDNNVTISFKNLDTKTELDEKQFTPSYSEDFDVIKQ